MYKFIRLCSLFYFITIFSCGINKNAILWARFKYELRKDHHKNPDFVTTIFDRYQLPDDLFIIKNDDYSDIIFREKADDYMFIYRAIIDNDIISIKFYIPEHRFLHINDRLIIYLDDDIIDSYNAATVEICFEDGYATIAEPVINSTIVYDLIEYRDKGKVLSYELTAVSNLFKDVK